MKVNLDIRLKLLLAIESIVVIMIAIMIISRITNMESLLYDRALKKVNTLGNVLLLEAEHDILLGDYNHLTEILVVVDDQPEIGFVSVVDGENHIKASSRKELVNIFNPAKDSRDMRTEKSDIFVKSFPLKIYKRYWGYVQISFELGNTRRNVGNLISSSTKLGLLTFFLTSLALWFVSNRLLRPLSDMKNIANKIALGDFSPKVEISARDVIGELGLALNVMTERLNDMKMNLDRKVEEAVGQLKESNKELSKKTQQLEETNKRLVELDKLKSEFVSIVSHELRTPLTGIIGFAHTLLKLELPRDQKRNYLEIIEQEGKRLGVLIEDFLDISKIESGNISLEPRQTNLYDIVKSALEVIRLPEGMSAEIKIQADFPRVMADPDRVKQVMVNILDNAVKYSNKGGRITVTGEDLKDEVKISITDEGRGIKEEELSRIFEKFFRGSYEGAENKRGSGLGLAIAKGIIEMHKGRIWVESEFGKGSSFIFTLPKISKP